jgi:hypothetical protein
LEFRLFAVDPVEEVHIRRLELFFDSILRDSAS